ncbi:diguanylate cyclase [Magnetococcus marinus]
MLALAHFCLAKPGVGAELSLSEREYIQQHGPFTFCVDPDWPPFEQINAQGVHVGIAADLLRLAAERAKIPLKLVVTQEWQQSIQASQRGDCQMLSFLNQTPLRDAWLVFTVPIFVDRNVIITREEHPYIEDLAAVNHQTMVLPKGTSMEERVRKDFPQLTILLAESESEAFAMVSKKKADMTMRSLMVAIDTIKKEGWFNLKIAGQIPGYENHLRVGIRKEAAPLKDMLNRGIKEISLAERAEVANRHVSIQVQSGIDYGLMAKIIGVFFLILVSNLFWILRLNRANERLKQLSRTDLLTGLPNRSFLNETLQHELLRAHRNGRPLSVVLLDIDHFKQVNDQYGHLVGDQVLVDFAQLLKKTVRGQDHVGRWGGEEFLILCPESDLKQTLVLCDRLHTVVRTHHFATQQQQTFSAGIALFTPPEEADGMLQRADEALYKAKRSGRDQSCIG